MAKKVLTQSTVATNNIQSQADQVKDQSTALKLAFDQYGIDSKAYNNNTLLTELQSETLNDSGAHAIGLKTANSVADNVADEIDLIRQAGSGTIPPDDSITLAKQNSTVKTGLLADLNTTDKTTFKDAINEVDSNSDTNTTNLDIVRIAKPDTGVADAYVVDTAGVFDRTVDGNTLPFIPSNANTGASTMAEDGQTAKAIKKWDPDAGPAAFIDIEADDIKVNVRVDLTWSVSNDFFIYSPKGGANPMDDWKETTSSYTGNSGGSASNLIGSVSGSGWITGLGNTSTNVRSFYLVVDGTAYLGSSTSSGVNRSGRCADNLMIRYETGFSVYCGNTNSTVLTYVEGDEFEQSTPKILTDSFTSTASTSVVNVTGEGWYYGGQYFGFYVKHTLDAVVLNSGHIFNGVSTMYKFNSSLLIETSGITNISATYTLLP